MGDNVVRLPGVTDWVADKEKKRRRGKLWWADENYLKVGEASLAQLKAAASKVMTENDQIKRRRRKSPYPLLGHRRLANGTLVPVYDGYGRS